MKKVFYIILLIFVCKAYSQTTTELTLNNFLYSKDIEVAHKSYLHIIKNQNKYKDLIYKNLIKCSRDTKQVNIPDRLIYIATYIKDKDFINPLTDLISNKDYSDNSCIYSCPIVFSLAIYSCFTEYKLSSKFDPKITPVKDLMETIKYINKISLAKESPSKNCRGPGIDSLLKSTEKLSFNEIIRQAGPQNHNYKSRYAAAVVLEATTDDDKYLDDLYWLAITEVKDASCEFRSAIYQAIYRAETARRLKNK